MITFKQKEFSPKSTKVIFKAKQAGNAVKSALKLAPKKTNMQLAREAIQTRNGLKPAAIKGKALDTAIGAAKKIESAMYQPGRAASRGIELVAQNPAAAVTYVATAPLPVPSAIISGAVNKAADKVPAYKRMANKLGNAWRNSKASRRLGNISGYDISRYAQMIPIA